MSEKYLEGTVVRVTASRLGYREPRAVSPLLA